MKHKKILAGILAFTIAAGTVVLPVSESGIYLNSAAFESMVNFAANTYGYIELEDGTIEISSYSGKDQTLTIPESIDGKTVTSIGNSCFSGRKKLTSVTIPDTVKNIGYCAFYNCTNLSGISIPESVTNIGGLAFDNTPWIKTQCEKQNNYVVVNGILIYCADISQDITVPESVNIVGDYAFYGNSSFKSVTIPDNITYIGCSAFNGCSNLSEVNIGSGVTSIGNGAFTGCSGLVELTIPKGVASIGTGAFNGCSELKEITIPDKVTTIEDFTFSDCTSLAKINIPESVTSIGENAFYNCAELENINIPDSIKIIGFYAFENCSKLKSINISENVEIIEEGAFSNCSSLESINVDKNNKNYSSVNGVLFDKNKTELMIYPLGKSSETFTIPSTVEFIGDYVFENCVNLTDINVEENNENYSSLNGVLFNKNKTRLIKYPSKKSSETYTIPESVTNIENFAFQKSEKLKNISLPEKLENIGVSAFENCKGLSEIKLPESVTIIGVSAFENCPALKEIKITRNIKSIGSDAFTDCTSLESINVDENNKNYSSDESGVLFNKDKTVLIQYPAGNTSKEYVIPDSVTKIENKALAQCVNLESINAGTNNQKYCSENGVLFNKKKDEIIRYPAGKTDEEYTIPTTVTAVGVYSFSCCVNLTNVIIPDNAIGIKFYAFTNCKKLEKVTIPKSFTIIQQYAFDNCSALKTVRYKSSESEWLNINISEGNDYLKKAEFYYNYNPEHTHQFGEWETVVNPTCTEKGNAQRKCSLCGETETKDLDATGHKYSEKVVTPTCTEKGYTIHICSDCKDTYKDNYTDATGHSYSEEWTIDVPATCTEKGSKSHHCTACGDKKDVTEIPATGHTFGEWKVTKNATCTQNGEEQRKCSVCNETETRIVKATGHKYVKVKVVKPTVNSQGYTLYKCSACGATVKKDFVAKLKKPGNTSKPVAKKTSIRKIKVKGLTAKSYTGKQIKPKIKVVLGKTTLKNGRDYTVKYGKNKSVGKGYITITGKGKYTGKITKSFKILPAKTYAKLSSTKGKIKVTLKKAKGAKKYQIQYATNKKFKSAKKVTVKVRRKNLKAKSQKVYYVRVRSVNGKYVSGWSAVKKIKVK